MMLLIEVNDDFQDINLSFLYSLNKKKKIPLYKIRTKLIRIDRFNWTVFLEPGL